MRVRNVGCADLERVDGGTAAGTHDGSGNRVVFSRDPEARRAATGRFAATSSVFAEHHSYALAPIRAPVEDFPTATQDERAGIEPSGTARESQRGQVSRATQLAGHPGPDAILM